MNLDSNYIKTEAGKPCYWLNDGVFNLPEWTRAMMQIAAEPKAARRSPSTVTRKSWPV